MRVAERLPRPRGWIFVLVGQVALLCGLAGCTKRQQPIGSASDHPAQGRAREQRRYAVESIRIEETTQDLVGDYEVGVGNIFEDEYTDSSGAKRTALHATFAIYDPETDREWHERLRAGQELILGNARYRVEHIHDGGDELGHVILRPAE